MTALAGRLPTTQLFSQLRDALSGLVPDPKRRSKSTGVDGWYPYYAGFSSDFAHAALRAVPLDAQVLDPWNGSGTTTTAATRLGLSSTGIDLNPFACLIAQAKGASFATTADALSFGDKIVDGAKAVNPHPDLKKWMPATVAQAFESLAASALKSGISDWPPSPQQSFVLLCLIRATRILSPPKGGSNPTWFRPPSRRKPARRELKEVFLETIGELAGNGMSASNPACSVAIRLGDSRHLPIDASTIDVVLTSPPYCTRIDYAASTAFELACLQAIAAVGDVAALRRDLMGTTKIRDREPKPVPDEWAHGVKRLLDAIRSHSSYASSGYYFKNFLQYFSDANAALAEMSRVLKRGGVAAIVLQTSFYKEILVDLPDLYTEMAALHCMDGEVVVRRALPSSRVMASLNPKTRTAKVPRRYEESVLLLEKP